MATLAYALPCPVHENGPTPQAEGLGLAQIAVQLTPEDISTHEGKPWHKGTVGKWIKAHGR